MKFSIPFRSATQKAPLEIEIDDRTFPHFWMREAVQIAVRNGVSLEGANLNGTDLRWAELEGADLRDADLGDADLRWAKLQDADLRCAQLDRAELDYADLSSAKLERADLQDARIVGANLWQTDLRNVNLREAILEPIRADLIAQILKLPNELDALRTAIVEGRIDGSVYCGSCACLAGTLARARGDLQYQGGDIEIAPDLIYGVDASSPRETWFTAIDVGDTPETNQAAALALEWVDEAIAIRDLIRATAGDADTDSVNGDWTRGRAL
jgi:hypothetical protein